MIYFAATNISVTQEVIWITRLRRHLHRWLCWLLEGLLRGGLDQGPDVAEAFIGFLEKVIDDLRPLELVENRDIIAKWRREACLGRYLGSAE